MVTFAVAALAALTGTYWVLKSMQGHSVSVSAAMAGAGVTGVDPQAVARALGGGNRPIAAASGQDTSGRNPYVLVGVVADPAHSGAALISVDGKPAKPYRVGAVVDGSLVLQSVTGAQSAFNGTIACAGHRSGCRCVVDDALSLCV